MSKFTLQQVKAVRDFLQNYMRAHGINQLTADECADLLAKNGILPRDGHVNATGYNFRQMLRDGRDKEISLVTGAYQERPHTKWLIGQVKR